MLTATFLGHQGWLFAADGARLLVDPLLGDEPAIRPARQLHLASLPEVQAVVVTHEHPDHFDLPSLARLPRRTPVYLSASSSSAAHQILAEMGFTVRALRPGEPVVAGALSLMPVAPDLMDGPVLDEWDSLPFVVRAADGSAFVSTVDAAITGLLLRRLHAVAPSPAVVNVSCNVVSYAWADLLAPTAAAAAAAGAARGFYAELAGLAYTAASVWRPPPELVITGNGLGLGAADPWLEARLFPVDLGVAVRSLTETSGFAARAPRPGETLAIAGNAVTVGRAAPFIDCPSDAGPPAGAGDAAAAAPDFAPLTGDGRFGEGEANALEAELAELARALYGQRLFRALLSAAPADGGGRRAELALVLRRRDAEPRVYVYEPQACRFVPSRCSDPVTQLATGFVCWASDFAAALAGSLDFHWIAAGRFRYWALAPRFELLPELVRFFHPLRRPERALAAYRRVAT